jgi:hypothetical protein
MATDTTMRQQLAEVFKDAVASHEEVMIECTCEASAAALSRD